MNMILRPATEEDAEAIRQLVRAAYAKWVPLIGREPRPMVADYVQAVRTHDFALLADGSKLVGLIETETRADHVWIENVAVAPQAQGSGHGRRLLAHAEELARSAGLTEVRLLTNEAFADNVGLYERSGYVTTHTTPFMGGTTLHMTKRLA